MKNDLAERIISELESFGQAEATSIAENLGGMVEDCDCPPEMVIAIADSFIEHAEFVRNEAVEALSKTRVMTIVQDEDGCEALYVDRVWVETGHDNIDATEIAQQAGDKFVSIKLLHCQGSMFDWPKLLADLLADSDS